VSRKQARLAINSVIEIIGKDNKYILQLWEKKKGVIVIMGKDNMFF
jgi:hypothetical protein